MNLSFKNKIITGILTVLPSKEVMFEDEIENYNFSLAQSLKLKKVMGFNCHRVVENGTTVSDLCEYGLNHLFDKNLLRKDEVDALILVTQSPDHFIPPTSNVIQGRLGLKNDIICMDINQGCSGFIIGLMQAFMLLDQAEINKVVLLNADTLSKKVSKRDRNSNPIIGDGASITIVEKNISEQKINCTIKMDGTDPNILIIPAGGFKTPCNYETSIMTEDSSGNFRSPENLVMKGDEVFNFVLREVPPMIENLLHYSGKSIDEIDYFMFHQPNKFILSKLADKMHISYDKMPNNVVENFGNSSGPSIPTAITFNLKERPVKETFMICIAGFGVGLTWSAMLLSLDKLKFCFNIDF